MLVLTLLPLLFAQMALDVPEFIKPEVAVQRLAACGFTGVESKFADELQSPVLIVGPAAATDEQLECAIRVARSAAALLILPEDLRERQTRIERRWGRDEARRWLAERGLLDRLPQYDAAKGVDASLARKLEALCGDKAKGALRAHPGMLTLDPEWRARQLGAEDNATECLIQSAAATGVSFGFIGNEVAVKPQ